MELTKMNDPTILITAHGMQVVWVCKKKLIG